MASATYFGCANGANKVRWMISAIFGIITGALLIGFVIAWIACVNDANEYNDCVEGSSSRYCDDTSGACRAWLILLVACIVTGIIACVPCCCMCCCAQRPEGAQGTQAAAAPYAQPAPGQAVAGTYYNPAGYAAKPTAAYSAGPTGHQPYAYSAQPYSGQPYAYSADGTAAPPAQPYEYAANGKPLP